MDEQSIDYHAPRVAGNFAPNHGGARYGPSSRFSASISGQLHVVLGSVERERKGASSDLFTSGTKLPTDIAYIKALSSSKITAKVLHRLLDLTEFMERAEKPLPLDNTVLGELAHRAGAYAKALYYFVSIFLRHVIDCSQEKEYKEAKQRQMSHFHNLITVNDKLGQHEAGNGLIKKAEATAKVKGEIPISWYEKIHNWSEARIS